MSQPSDPNAALRKRFEEWRDREWGAALTPGGSYEMALWECCQAFAPTPSLLDEVAREIAQEIDRGQYHGYFVCVVKERIEAILQRHLLR